VAAMAVLRGQTGQRGQTERTNGTGLNIKLDLSR
jgi:hypothetical protein